MANKIIGLPAPFLLPCFISGLTPEIRHAVQAHQPMTVDQAVGLAKLQEQQMTNLCLPPHLRPPPPRSTTILPLLPSPPSPPPMVKRLTPEEPTFRRERGMCFTCDERYLRGHYDASKASLLVVEDEDSNSLNTDPVDPTLDLKRALLVALRCTDPNAQKRPKMGHVIHMLEAEDSPYKEVTIISAEINSTSVR